MKCNLCITDINAMCWTAFELIVEYDLYTVFSVEVKGAATL